MDSSGKIARSASHPMPMRVFLFSWASRRTSLSHSLMPHRYLSSPRARTAVFLKPPEPSNPQYALNLQDSSSPQSERSDKGWYQTVTAKGTEDLEGWVGTISAFSPRPFCLLGGRKTALRQVPVVVP